MKRSDFIIGFLVLIVFISSFLHYIGLRVWPEAELSRTTTAAVLSVIISAVITCLMLKWQSRSETEKERDSRVYEQKLSICMEFLNEVCAIVEDGVIELHEANKLKFTFSKVAIHLSDVNLEKISRHLNEIAQHCDELSHKPIELSGELMSIVYIIREELYPDKAASMRNERAKQEIIASFRAIDNKVEQAHDNSELTELENMLSKTAKELDKELEGWTSKATPAGELELTKKDAQWGTPSKLSLKMSFSKKGAPYFSCKAVMDSPHDAPSRLYPYLQKRYGGGFSNEHWSRLIDGECGKLLKRGHWDRNGQEMLSNHLKEELTRLACYFDDFVQNYEDMVEFRDKHAAGLPEWKWNVFDNNGMVLVHESQKVECTFTYDRATKQARNITLHRLDINNQQVNWNDTEDQDSIELLVSEQAAARELPVILGSLKSRFKVQNAADKLAQISTQAYEAAAPLLKRFWPRNTDRK